MWWSVLSFFWTFSGNIFSTKQKSKKTNKIIFLPSMVSFFLTCRAKKIHIFNKKIKKYFLTKCALIFFSYILKFSFNKNKIGKISIKFFLTIYRLIFLYLFYKNNILFQQKITKLFSYQVCSPESRLFIILWFML